MAKIYRPLSRGYPTTNAPLFPVSLAQPPLQGPEGRKLAEAAEKAWKQWMRERQSISDLQCFPEAYVFEAIAEAERAQHVENTFEFIAALLHDRGLCTVGSQLVGEVPRAGQAEYESVPAKRAFTASVQFEFRGRGKPLPYDFDEE